MKNLIVLFITALFLFSCNLDKRYLVDTNIQATPEILVGDWNFGHETFIKFNEDGTGKIMHSKIIAIDSIEVNKYIFTWTIDETVSVVFNNDVIGEDRENGFINAPFDNWVGGMINKDGELVFDNNNYIKNGPVTNMNITLIADTFIFTSTQPLYISSNISDIDEDLYIDNDKWLDVEIIDSILTGKLDTSKYTDDEWDSIVIDYDSLVAKKTLTLNIDTYTALYDQELNTYTIEDLISHDFIWMNIELTFENSESITFEQKFNLVPGTNQIYNSVFGFYELESDIVNINNVLF